MPAFRARLETTAVISRDVTVDAEDERQAKDILWRMAGELKPDTARPDWRIDRGTDDFVLVTDLQALQGRPWSMPAHAVRVLGAWIRGRQSRTDSAKPAA